MVFGFIFRDIDIRGKIFRCCEYKELFIFFRVVIIRKFKGRVFLVLRKRYKKRRGKDL